MKKLLHWRKPSEPNMACGLPGRGTITFASKVLNIRKRRSKKGLKPKVKKTSNLCPGCKKAFLAWVAEGKAKKTRTDEWGIEAEEKVMMFEGPDYANAIIGVASQYTKKPLVVYDRDKCIEYLMIYGMTYEQAEEFFCFNTECAWFGDQTPIILTKTEDM